jgi:hypothetical protein
MVFLVCGDAKKWVSCKFCVAVTGKRLMRFFRKLTACVPNFWDDVGYFPIISHNLIFCAKILKAQTPLRLLY